MQHQTIYKSEFFFFSSLSSDHLGNGHMISDGHKQFKESLSKSANKFSQNFLPQSEEQSLKSCEKGLNYNMETFKLKGWECIDQDLTFEHCHYRGTADGPKCWKVAKVRSTGKIPPQIICHQFDLTFMTLLL